MADASISQKLDKIIDILEVTAQNNLTGNGDEAKENLREYFDTWE